ncbi:hypothetical protein P3L10_018025 [Capsicum annuum]
MKLRTLSKECLMLILITDLLLKKSLDSISDDELVERVTELAVLLQNSLDILTDKENLKEAMSRFPGSHVLVW